VTTVTKGRLAFRLVLRSMTVAIALSGAATGGSQPMQLSSATQSSREYADPQGRFTFAYPAAYGTASPGTNTGFRNRVAAIRFTVFSSGGIGGEAVLTRGAPSLDVQAAGGLYDDIASEALSDAARQMVERVLPPLTRDTLCDQLGRERHVDPSAAAFASLGARQRQALGELDRLGNIDPVMLRCSVSGDTVTFHKHASMVPGGPRRHVYGAVRFLGGQDSTFQLIRAGAAIDDAVITEMQGVVTSFR
jgi:hypothetical protein